MHQTSALPRGSKRVRSANARALADLHEGLFRGQGHQDQEIQPSSTAHGRAFAPYRPKSPNGGGGR
jgi:hypothetical protein